ncbi:hypothetical protein [Amycolatopsis albispora]|uniref:Uncharacterized protein n=1 Tax=Amycolatopsis albispora TaxID=1804986 RepID=A0A344LGX5_9PSEU|nr:hypothetical protein [Amycolatopsis albispora]AXB47299.1 hypothetical protein A4R43_36640 [Amycolatopsis albispora]
MINVKCHDYTDHPAGTVHSFTEQEAARLLETVSCEDFENGPRCVKAALDQETWCTCPRGASGPTRSEFDVYGTGDRG